MSLVAVALLAGLVSLTPAPVSRRPASSDLGFEQRVEAQRAIERVYWEHRVWPAENPGSKPPLEKVLSDDVLRARVTRYLKLSEALAAVWGRPVDGAQLQAEMQRMVTSSVAPSVLGELFDALGRDAKRIAETLARPALVERLARNAYAADDRFHGALRQRAEAAMGKAALRDAGGVYHEERWTIGDTLASPSLQADATAMVVSEPEWKEALVRLSDRVLEEDADAFRVKEVVAKEDDAFVLGVAVWAKTPFEAWWADRERDLSPRIVAPSYAYVLLEPSGSCVPDTWRPTRSGVPDGRREHSAVWTGTEMIVWGGTTYSLRGMDTGGVYDPATDTWRAISRGAGTPSPRAGHTAVWTGSKMIVWGGQERGQPFIGPPLGDGGVYDPTTDTWQPIAAVPGSPPARSGHTAVWTGTEMIVWGGQEAQGCGGDGARYDPATKDWTAVSPAGPSVRCRHTAVWTGTEMIVWGGLTSEIAPAVLATGGRYDPATDKWKATSIGANVPRPRAFHTAVWTGDGMIVFGGSTPVMDDVEATTRSGARYDPGTDAWTPIADDHGRVRHSAVWTGKEMILWGGPTEFLQFGSRYDPSTNGWAPTAEWFRNRTGATAVWTGTEMIVWAGDGKNGGRYSPASDTWIPTSMTPSIPEPRFRFTMVWTGAEMVVWGGYGGGIGALSSGGRYDPAIDDWKVVPDFEPARYYHSAVWTGTVMIVWGGYSFYGYENTGGRYDPTADAWTETGTGPGVPSPRVFPHAFWTGTEMLIWGGDDTRPTNTGGLYDPATESWRATSTGENVPLPGPVVTVWTGAEMIVWGHYRPRFDYPVQITGGRYDPVTNSWGPVAEDQNTPVPRFDASAVWTGHEMIVWGGKALNNAPLDTGGLYDPTTDQWAPPASAGISRRFAHTAVWTGTEMIVWGGQGVLGLLQNGGRYDPAAGRWLALSTGAEVPPPRSEHRAVWTGTEMIVWGDDSGLTVVGGCYCGLPVRDLPNPGPVPGSSKIFRPQRR